MHTRQECPIHRLSDDILVMIFLHYPAIPPAWVAQAATAAVDQPQATLPDLTWLNITHVCRRWRGISLGYGSIWTCIPFKPPCAASTFLKRARQAPLHINADWIRDGSRHHINDAVALALNRLSHCHFLRLHNPPAGFIEHMMTAFAQQDAGLLETLDLANVEEGAPSLGILVPAVQFPDQPFASPTPQLRRLMLTGHITMSWNNQLLTPNLTHLYLAFTDNTSAPTMDELLEFLRRCQVLEELLLIGCLPRRPQQMLMAPLLTDYPFVFLPSLRIISLADVAVNVAEVLRRLRLPADCHVRLRNFHMWNVTSTTATTEALASEVGHVVSARSPPSQGLALHLSQPHEHACSWVLANLNPAWISLPRSAIRQLLQPPYFTMTLEVPSRQTNMFEIERDGNMCAGVTTLITPLRPPESTRFLSISTHNPFIMRETWATVLRNMCPLEIIRVQAHCCYPFILAFAAFARDPEFLPWLRHIDFLNADLVSRIRNIRLGRSLEEACYRRKELPLDFEVRNCRISPAQVRRIEKALGCPVFILGEPNTWGVGRSQDEEEDEEDEEESEGAIVVDD